MGTLKSYFDNLTVGQLAVDVWTKAGITEMEIHKLDTCASCQSWLGSSGVLKLYNRCQLKPVA
jgi:hypothetical protein